MKLEGKSAIVTAGGQGIGRDIALELAREGADVLVTDRQLDSLQETASLIEKLGRRALAVVTEVPDEYQTDEMVHTALENFGKVDILINNGAISNPTRSMTESEIEKLENEMADHLTSAFLLVKAVIPQMLERGAGKIVNIGSETAQLGNDNRIPDAKWGILDFSETLAQELGPHNIQVNTICAGPIETRSDSKSKEKYVPGTSLQRTLKPQQIASAVIFFCSAEGDSISGEALQISAGYAL